MNKFMLKTLIHVSWLFLHKIIILCPNLRIKMQHCGFISNDQPKSQCVMTQANFTKLKFASQI